MRRAGIALAALAVAGCTSAPRPPAQVLPPSQPYVVMISFDAFRYDYFDRYRPRAIVEVAARGARSEALIPSFPSKTFPNHYTLVTGLYPGHHGITGNSFYDPERKTIYKSGDSMTVRDSSWYGGEPIWASAVRNGVRSAAYFWPGSEAAIRGIRPTYFTRYDGKVPNSERVTGVMSWLRMPEPERPHLVLMYFSEVDDTTHKFGPEAAQTERAVADVDRALRQLLDSLRALPFGDSVNIVLVSDHGMVTTPATRVIPVMDLMLGAGIDTTAVVLSDNGPTMSLWFGRDALKLAKTKLALDAKMEHATSYLLPDTPRAWHVDGNPRFGDLLLVAEPGYILQRRASDKAPSLGSHGYAPDVQSMRGLFVAAGPGVTAAGLIPPVENVNVYPFVCELLKISCPSSDGSAAVLRGILKQ